jgi:hypothetical protein
MKFKNKTYKRIRVSILTLALVLGVFGLCGPLQLTALADVVVTANNNTIYCRQRLSVRRSDSDFNGFGQRDRREGLFRFRIRSKSGLPELLRQQLWIIRFLCSLDRCSDDQRHFDITTYQAFLRSVTYNNGSATSGTKTVYFSVSQSTPAHIITAERAIFMNTCRAGSAGMLLRTRRQNAPSR